MQFKAEPDGRTSVRCQALVDYDAITYASLPRWDISPAERVGRRNSRFGWRLVTAVSSGCLALGKKPKSGRNAEYLAEGRLAGWRFGLMLRRLVDLRTRGKVGRGQPGRGDYRGGAPAALERGG